MLRPRFALPALLLPCFALTALSACGEEDTRLFKEPGVWSVTHYSEDGTSLNAVPPATQEDAFMFNFNRDKGILATAACAFGSGNTPATSTCNGASSEDEKDWECTCYSYEFQGSTIRLTEFMPGDSAPPVMGSDTDGANGSAEIMVAEFAEISNSYLFTPLPGPSPLDLDGLFGSNGVNSQYVFLKRFEGVFENSGCASVCFGD